MNPWFSIMYMAGLPFLLVRLLIEWWPVREDPEEDYYLGVAVTVVYFIIRIGQMAIIAFESREELLRELVPFWLKLIVEILCRIIF
jgi:hypothetical protein